MRLKTLRESLQPTITTLTECADYWSEMHMRGKIGQAHYFKCVKYIEELKLYVLEEERKQRDEELRVPSRANGGLHKETHDNMEDSGVERFG